MAISVADKEKKPYEPGNFELSLTLQAVENELPDANFNFPEGINSGGQHEVSMVELFPDWDNAYKKLPIEAYYISITKISDSDEYQVLGSLYFANQQRDSMYFRYRAKIPDIDLEVTGIRVVAGSNEGKGHFTINENKFVTNFALENREMPYRKIILSNKNIITDKEIQHGVLFMLPGGPYYIPTGTFLYAKSTTETGEKQDFIPSVFNDGIIEQPVSAKLMIKQTGEKYQINYSMKLEDNRILTGVYQGEIGHSDLTD